MAAADRLSEALRVLNALRQSEENHEPQIEVNKVKIECSTPYGNQRKITSGRNSCSHQPLVLNALRQSEENHVARQPIAAGQEIRAQRLTAIRGKSHH